MYFVNKAVHIYPTINATKRLNPVQQFRVELIHVPSHNGFILTGLCAPLRVERVNKLARDDVRWNRGELVIYAIDQIRQY